MSGKLLTTSNKKMKELRAKHGLPRPIPVWGITAGKYCPSAKECKVNFTNTNTKCFGLSGAYLWPVVKAKYEWRAEQTKRDDFVDNMVAELKRSKSPYVRIHDIGDFYSDDYFAKWRAIMMALPDKTFWCYTKEVERFKRLVKFMPDNFRYVFSFGGVHDHLIDKDKDRFSKVISHKDEGKALAMGWHDLTEDELRIVDNKYRKFYTLEH